MKKICILLICAGIHAQAQTNLNWVFSNVGSMNGYVNQKFRCANGDLLMLGDNNGADIDPGPGVNTSGNNFFARYSPSGNLIFGHPCSYAGNLSPQPGWLVNDVEDNFYLTFMSPGFYDLDTATGIGEITLSSSEQLYVKYDGMGNYKWSMVFHDYAYVFYTAVLSDKSIVIVGCAWPYPTDLDPGPGVYMFDPHNTSESFLARYDSSGNFITAREFHTSTGMSQELCIILQIKSDHNDNVYLSGYYEGTVDFDPGPGTHNLYAPPGVDRHFLLKLDSNLNFVYAYRYPEMMSFDTYIDNSNNLFLVGSAGDSVDIDPTPNVYMMHPGGTFITKLHPGASVQWVKTMTSNQGNWISFNGFENDGSM